MHTDNWSTLGKKTVLQFAVGAWSAAHSCADVNAGLPFQRNDSMSKSMKVLSSMQKEGSYASLLWCIF